MTTISENDIVDLTNGTVQRTEYGQIIMALGSNNRAKFLRLDDNNNQKISLYNSNGSPITSTDPLDVQLSTGDIEIGAVEIKNHNTDDRVEVDTNNSLKTKLSISGSDITTSVPLPIVKGLNIPIFDYAGLTYVGTGSNGAGEIETVIYKTGGAGGSTVATLTLTYNSDNNLATVTHI